VGEAIVGMFTLRDSGVMRGYQAKDEEGWRKKVIVGTGEAEGRGKTRETGSNDR
jgi:hypothetical protein